MGEHFVKVAVNLDTHPKIRRAGRNGREVFQFVLRRVGQLDTNGVVPASCVEPWYLADVLMMPEADAAEGLSRAVTARLLAVDGDSIRVVGWDEEWAKRPRTDAERKADQRAREKVTVTTGHADVTPAVTQRDSHGCHASEESREEETRLEKTQNTSPGAAAPSAASRPRSGSGKGKAKAPDLSPAEAESVAGVLDKLSRESGTPFRATSVTHQRVLVARLREGVTEDEMRAVILHCADPKPHGLGWRDNPEMRVFLRPETLFGPTTIERYLPAARKMLAEMEASS